jgi:CheY-like chemotaxis protein
VQNALSRLGYRVFQAPSGVAALEVWKLHGNEIRLLLTDLMLPGGMTGKALAEQLVQNDPKLKVMYASLVSLK